MKKKYFVLIYVFLVLIAPNIANAMHIAEGFISPKWCLFWGAISLPFIVLSFRKIKSITTKTPDKKLLLALVGAFVFVLSALKIPSVTGSCSHPTGVGLGAVLFGPMAMVGLGFIVLVFQALMLAHGGITTLGANTFSMAIVGPFVAYGIFKLFKKFNVKSSVAVFFAAALGDLMTYIVTAVQLSLAHPDPVGGIAVSLQKFLTIFALTQIPLAIAEGLLSVIVYNLIVEYKKEGGLTLEDIA